MAASGGGQKHRPNLEYILEILLMGFNDVISVGGRDREESRMNPRFGAPEG